MKIGSLKISIFFMAVALSLFFPATLFAAESTPMKTLIVYYSRTGNTKAACEALQKELRADILEIHDLKNRKGGWGFFTGAIGSLFSTHTRIEPATPDLTAYSNIIIGSPVWAGKLSTAIRTFIAKNGFDGKKVIILTTTNALEKEGSQNKTKTLVQKSGGDVAGYYQVLAREKVDGKRVERTKQQIADDVRKLVSEIKKALPGAF